MLQNSVQVGNKKTVPLTVSFIFLKQTSVIQLFLTVTNNVKATLKHSLPLLKLYRKKTPIDSFASSEHGRLFAISASKNLTLFGR